MQSLFFTFPVHIWYYFLSFIHFLSFALGDHVVVGLVLAVYRLFGVLEGSVWRLVIRQICWIIRHVGLLWWSAVVALWTRVLFGHWLTCAITFLLFNLLRNFICSVLHMGQRIIFLLNLDMLHSWWCLLLECLASIWWRFLRFFSMAHFLLFSFFKYVLMVQDCVLEFFLHIFPGQKKLDPWSNHIHL